MFIYQRNMELYRRKEMLNIVTLYADNKKRQQQAGAMCDGGVLGKLKNNIL